VGKGKRHAAEYRALVGILRDLRRTAGLTQAQLADRLGKPQSYVSKVERGERLIDPIELRWWCRAVGTDVTAVIKQWDGYIS
jgi:transcriptional regulator with XRE-family HTH domain